MLVAASAAVFLVACGAGTETTGAADASESLDACACLDGMAISLRELIEDPSHASWSAAQWSEGLAKNTSPCMTVERTAEELNVWYAAQKECSSAKAYASLLTDIREKLSVISGTQREQPQDIRELSENGAKGLLDQLSKQNQ